MKKCRTMYISAFLCLGNALERVKLLSEVAAVISQVYRDGSASKSLNGRQTFIYI